MFNKYKAIELMMSNVNNIGNLHPHFINDAPVNRALLIREKLDEVHTLIGSKETMNDGFLSGKLGLLCYYYYAGKILRQSGFTDKAAILLQNIFDGINTQNAKLAGCTFSNGLAGFAAVVSHLQQQGFIEFHIQSEMAELDEMLYISALECIDKYYNDFLHGAFGIVHYFSLRTPTETIINYLQKLINAISKKAVVECDNGIWFRNRSLNNEDINQANLSLSHGLCGMLLILMNACKIMPAVTVSTVKQIVQKGIKFILQHHREPDESRCKYSQFPFFVRTDLNNNENIPNRLAWCYGDLNEVLLFYRAGNFLKDKHLRSMSYTIGMQTAARLNEASTLITNAHFCHGASGIAQFYKILYNETCLPQYCDLYNIWIDKTLNYLSKDIEEKTFEGKETDLLEGLIGAAFVLVSSTEVKPTNWSKLLLL